MGFCPSGLLSQWAFVRSPKISPHPSDNWIIKALYRLAIFDLSSADFFFHNQLFRKNISRICFVGPDLGESCLQNVSANDTKG